MLNQYQIIKILGWLLMNVKIIRFLAQLLFYAVINRLNPNKCFKKKKYCLTVTTFFVVVNLVEMVL